MSKKKPAVSEAIGADEKESFVVLFDEAQENTDSNQKADAEGDSSFVVMLDEEEAPATASSESGADGSFVVLLDDEGSESGGETAQDDYFVVLLDDEDRVENCVLEVSEGVFEVSLPADIRIQKVVVLKPELVATLGASKVHYDASRVALADTASIQVVAAHLVALAAADASVEWRGASDEFLTTARVLGFEFGVEELNAEIEEAIAA